LKKAEELIKQYPVEKIKINRTPCPPYNIPRHY